MFLVTAGGGEAEHYEYTAYGERTIFDPAGVELPTSAIGMRLGFQGQFADDDLQLVYMRARSYLPQWGRFLSPDPIGYEDGSNRYAFVRGAPLLFIDPLGLSIRSARQKRITQLVNVYMTYDHLIAGIYGYNSIAQIPTLPEPSNWVRFSGLVRSGIGGVAFYASAAAELAPGAEVAATAGLTLAGDQVITGLREVWTGRPQRSLLEGSIAGAAHIAGVPNPDEVAHWAAMGIDAAIGGYGLARAFAPRLVPWLAGSSSATLTPPVSVVDDIALGLDRDRSGNFLTKPWADEIGAVAQEDWIARGLADKGPFVRRFYQAAYRTVRGGGRIKFNLDDFSLRRAFKVKRFSDPFAEAADGTGNVTNWELQQVLHNEVVEEFGCSAWAAF